jgi:O-antigen ligase
VNVLKKTTPYFNFFFLLFSSPFIVASQKFIIGCFIASFYFGVSFGGIQMASVDFADISILVIAVSFFSFLLVPSSKIPAINPAVKPVFYSLCAFVAWCIISALLNLFHGSKGKDWQSIWFILNFIQLPVGLYIFSSESMQKYRSFIFSTILFFSLIEFFTAVDQFFILRDAPAQGTFLIHHALLGIMMVFAAVISIYRMMVTKKRKYKLLYGVLFFLSLYTIILSETRSILVGIAIALVVYLIHFFKFTVKHIILFGMGFLLIFALIKFTPLDETINKTIHSTETPLSLDMSSFGRLLIWKGSVEHFIKSPISVKLIGCGPGKFWTIPFNFFVFDKKGSSGAHNNFLHAIMETGIIGFILFSLFFSITLYSLHGHSKTDPLARLFFYGTITLLGSGISQETFWMQHVFGNLWLFYLVILGIILAKPTAAAPNTILPDVSGSIIAPHSKEKE